MSRRVISPGPTVAVDVPGTIILQDDASPFGESWLAYTSPRETIEARRLDQVLPLLSRVDQATRAGLQAAGFLCYEAAPAFDPSFVTSPPGTLPLAWFGIYDRWTRLPRLPSWSAEVPGPHEATTGEVAFPDWSPSESDAEHRAAVERIRAFIAAGDVYQVNHTHRLRTRLGEPPWSLFRRLVSAQGGRCAAWVALEEHLICSASPELFFLLAGEEIESRPMKGTAPRGRSSQEDQLLGTRLTASAKDRAENLMITDMVRNDLGRIAETGSVRVDALWELERYETVWQLTSTVRARTRAPLVEIFRGLFPGASITGAPKIRAMEIIAGLEREARGVYTGCIGRVGPGSAARFNIAIRTAVVERGSGRAEYGTGGGIVWDSEPDRERQECRHKARLLSAPPRPEFRLFETLRWSPAGELFLRERHLDRLAASAGYFGFRFDRVAAGAALEREAAGLGDRPGDASMAIAVPRGHAVDGPAARRHAQPGPATPEPAAPEPLLWRIRLFLDRDGALATDATPLAPAHRVWTVALAVEPVDERDPFLFHKTTHREPYDRPRRDQPGMDDVLLWNRRGEITESTRANLAVRLDGVWVTPALDCGLLPGTLRQALLARNRLREAIVRVEDLARAERLVLFNSLRGVIRVERRRYTHRHRGAGNEGWAFPSRAETSDPFIGSPGWAGDDDPGASEH
jgi:para-aminobenzoate synthetase/4-amino-4-deoxychorismate lyase